MTIKTYREAVKEALAQEMERDERVVLIGEDLRGGHGGNAPEEAKIEAFGGVLGVTKGLWTQFGSDRVIDTPITESAIIGMAAGAAATGLRPVAELMFMDFFGVSHDALYNQAAKFRYMFGGKARAPLVMRGMIGAGFSAAAQHSQSPYNIFATTHGLKVVVPSTPYDVKGLLIQSIRDDDPWYSASINAVRPQGRGTGRDLYHPARCSQLHSRRGGRHHHCVVGNGT